MNAKILKVLGIILIVVLFIAVIITSVLITNKKKATDDIPSEATHSYSSMISHI